MQSWNVKGVRGPRLHDFLSHEGNIEIARSYSFRIKRSPVFVTLVGNHTAAQNDSGSFREPLLQLPVKGNKESLVAAKSQGHNTGANFHVAHLMSIFRHIYFRNTF